MEEKLYCRKCLIPDFIEDKEKFLNNYVNTIPTEEKAEEDVYERRLEICYDCSHYLNGMCRLCGCFVAIRAAVKKQYCPGTINKWE